MKLSSIGELSLFELFNIQHFLYFFPLPQGHGAFRPIFAIEHHIA